MSTVTKNIADFIEPGTANHCVFQYDYDDGTLRVLAFRCINDTGLPAYGWVARANNFNVNYSATFPANTTTEYPVGQGAANRLQLTLLPNGKLDGVEKEMRYPA